MKKKTDVESLRDKDIPLKELFWKILKDKKDPKELTRREIAALIARSGYLSDDEREYYGKVLIKSNLTDKDKDRYCKLGLIDKYFKGD